jgi:hypothetical protein
VVNSRRACQCIVGEAGAKAGVKKTTHASSASSGQECSVLESIRGLTYLLITLGFITPIIVSESTVCRYPAMFRMEELLTGFCLWREVLENLLREVFRTAVDEVYYSSNAYLASVILGRYLQDLATHA